MKNFRTYDLAVRFYKEAQSIKVPPFLRDQLNRASSSIVLNLAEGRGRRTTKDQVRFFHIALGSIRECEAIIALATTPASTSINPLATHCVRLIQNAR